MSTQEKHSPLPWRVDLDSEGWVTDVLDADDGHVVCFGHDYDEYGSVSTPDAEFIVRAVNAHDDLVAAVQELLSIAECYEDEDLYTRAVDALAKAKGQ